MGYGAPLGTMVHSGLMNLNDRQSGRKLESNWAEGPFWPMPGARRVH